MNRHLIFLKEEALKLSMEDFLLKISNALPSDNDFASLRWQLKWQQRRFHENLVQDSNYEFSIVKIKAAIDFFLAQLPEDQLRKVYYAFVGEVKKVNVLYVQSSPANRDVLQGSLEYSIIEDNVRSSASKIKFEVKPLFAATIEKFINAVNNEQVNFVHFSSHAGKNGIVLNDDENNAEVVCNEVLLKIFSQVKSPVDFILVNGCLSIVQAKILSEVAGFAVGMEDYITDLCAIAYTKCFYKILVGQEVLDYEKIFNLSISAFMVKCPDEYLKPTLWKSGSKIA